MKTYSTAVTNLLQAGRIGIRGMIVFAFGTGTHRFVRDAAELTWDEQTYAPGGVLEVSDLPSSVGLSAESFAVTLAASPDDGLTPDVLQTIEDEDYRDRPVTIFDALIHPDTGEILAVDPVKRGYVDTIEHEEDPEGGYRLVAACEDRQLDFTRTNGRRRSHQDQQRRSSGDLFLNQAGMRRTEEVYWGKLKTGAGLPAPASTSAQSDPGGIIRKFFGGFGLNV